MRSLLTLSSSLLFCATLFAFSTVGFAQEATDDIDIDDPSSVSLTDEATEEEIVEEESAETPAQRKVRLIEEAHEKRKTKEGLAINKQLGVDATGGFVLAPGSFYEVGDPGDVIEVQLSLLNKSGEDTIYEIHHRDVAVSDLGGPAFMGGGQKGPFPALEWLDPATNDIVLRHGERAYIPVKITIPEKADSGDHMAALLFKQKRFNDPEAGGVKVNSYTSVLFIITVRGDVVTEGSLVGIYPRSTIQWSNDIDLFMEVENRGTIHIAPEGRVEIRNIFGVPVDEFFVRNFHVLRESTKKKIFHWNPKFALGRYTAHTNIELNTKVNTLPVTQVSTAFWVIPLLPLIIAIVAIFLVSYLVQAFFSRFEIRKKESPPKK